MPRDPKIQACRFLNSTIPIATGSRPVVDDCSVTRSKEGQSISLWGFWWFGTLTRRARIFGVAVRKPSGPRFPSRGVPRSPVRWGELIQLLATARTGPWENVSSRELGARECSRVPRRTPQPTVDASWCFAGDARFHPRSSARSSILRR